MHGSPAPIFQVEELASFLKPNSSGKAAVDEIMPIFKEHWQEVAKFKHLLSLAPNMQKYVDFARAGRLHFITMRLDGKLIGYSVHIIVHGHLHYRQLVWAEDDIHYIAPAYRGSGLHEEMRVFALKTLKEKGVDFVTARTKEGHQHDATLRAVGYEPMDRVYGLDLKNWSPYEKTPPGNGMPSS
jgi:L-amino acid N-acyltransferase YncA